MSRKELKYKYIYFNENYGKRWKVDPWEYNAICLRDVENLKGVHVVQCIPDFMPQWVRFLFCIHTSKKINKKIRLPFQKLWYPIYFKKKKETKPYCFVVARYDLPIDYLTYLKKKYPDCRLVKIHRDLVKITYNYEGYSEKNMRNIFDLRMTYDIGEGKLYGFPTFNEIESKINVPIANEYPLCDVFFAGKAKDRLEKLVKAYDIFEKAGLKCEFYITNVSLEEQVQRDGITYSDKYMPYIDMLYKSVNARCILDINQEGAVGYTSRIIEAIIYNKKLITDNITVLKSKYYDQHAIQYIKIIEDIDPQFVNQNCEVNYCYEGDFSPIHLIYQIDRELTKYDAIDFELKYK